MPTPVMPQGVEGVSVSLTRVRARGFLFAKEAPTGRMLPAKDAISCHHISMIQYVPMNYLPRKLICERLRLSVHHSYAIVAPSYGPLINGDEVLHIVNEARRGIREPLDCIPCDMMTADELSADPAINGLLTTHRILTWTHRAKNVPPHFRFNKQTTRFSRRLFFAWLSARSRLRRRDD